MTQTSPESYQLQEERPKYGMELTERWRHESLTSVSVSDLDGWMHSQWGGDRFLWIEYKSKDESLKHDGQMKGLKAMSLPHGHQVVLIFDPFSGAPSTDRMPKNTPLRMHVIRNGQVVTVHNATIGKFALYVKQWFFNDQGTPLVEKPVDHVALIAEMVAQGKTPEQMAKALGKPTLEEQLTKPEPRPRAKGRA